MARPAYRPAPPLRDRSLDLDHLQRLARTFDAIGDEIGGARYPAVAFVQWLADASGERTARPQILSACRRPLTIRDTAPRCPGGAPLARRHPEHGRRIEVTETWSAVYRSWPGQANYTEGEAP